MLLINNDVARQVLNMRDCIAAQEAAFAGLVQAGADVLNVTGVTQNVDYSYDYGLGDTFEVLGFDPNNQNFVTMSGQISFVKSGTKINLVGNQMSVSLAVGALSLGLSNASFGLQTDGTNTVFELSGGVFSAAISGMSSIGASSVLVQYASAAGTMLANTVLAVGAGSYTFLNNILAGTMVFTVTGFVADVSDFAAAA